MMWGLKELPFELDKLLGVEKVTPPSVEALNRMLELVFVSSSHTAKMLPAESSATCGVNEKSVLFETFLGEEKTIWACAVEQITAKPKVASARKCPQRLRKSMTILLCASSGLGTGPSNQSDSRMHRASLPPSQPCGEYWLAKTKA